MSSKQAKVIAYLGKGGAGKTVLACLTAHILIERGNAKILLVDADPTQGLVLALGKPVVRTVSDIRAALVKEAADTSAESDSRRLSMTVDYLMLQALEERERYSLLAMGHGDGPGCFCPVNSLLRESIEELARAFDWIVIDAEAGIEQVNRQVTRRVDYPLVVTDSSMRGASAAEAISSALLRVGSPAPTGVLFNRTVAPADPLLNRVRRAGLRVLGAIPMDPTIARFDHDGQSLLELPQTSPALQTLRKVLAEIG